MSKARGVNSERYHHWWVSRAAEHDANLHPDLVDEDVTGSWRSLMLAVNLRSARDIRRACRPTWESPISPSDFRFRGQGRHGDDDDVDGIERTSMSQISSACSPVSAGDEQVVDVDAQQRHRWISACSIDEGKVAPFFWLRRSPAGSARSFTDDSGP